MPGVARREREHEQPQEDELPPTPMSFAEWQQRERDVFVNQESEKFLKFREKRAYERDMGIAPVAPAAPAAPAAPLTFEQWQQREREAYVDKKRKRFLQFREQRAYEREMALLNN